MAKRPKPETRAETEARFFAELSSHEPSAAWVRGDDPAGDGFFEYNLDELWKEEAKRPAKIEADNGGGCAVMGLQAGLRAQALIEALPEEFRAAGAAIADAAAYASGYAMMEFFFEYSLGPENRRLEEMHAAALAKLKRDTSAANDAKRRADWPKKALEAWASNPTKTTYWVATHIAESGDHIRSIIRAIEYLAPQTSPSWKPKNDP